jgi:hypothetical protein
MFMTSVQQAGVVVTLYTVSERRLVQISARTLMKLFVVFASPSTKILGKYIN